MSQVRFRGVSRFVALAAAIMLLALPTAHAAKLKKQNLTQLITASESILFGTVKNVTDGFDDQGVPYTEVTLAVGSAAKGKAPAGQDYTFRQFGLLKPRTNADGKTYLAVTPEGFPRWAKDEVVVAFMYKPASITGLQTTAGMAQGKLNLVNGHLSNSLDNNGLFEGVDVDPKLLSADERAMLQARGAVDATVFMGLVGRAVSEGWIENGSMK